MNERLVDVRDVRLEFPGAVGSPPVVAVDGVDLSIGAGEIVALVGESGSGKSTLARILARLYPPTSGEVTFRGEPIGRSGRGLRAHYRAVQLIYQDPFGSLNSLKRIEHIVGRPLQIHKITSLRAGDPSGVRAPSRSRRRELVDQLLEKVSLTPAEDFRHRFPGDLSGGQRQRVAIARALAVRPDLLLADEPTSMLDASMRIDVLNLLRRLRDTEGLSVLFITHDIASARYLSDRIYVMYQGRVVDSGPTETLIGQPGNDYTRRLLDAAPDPTRYKGSGRSVFDREDHDHNSVSVDS